MLFLLKVAVPPLLVAAMSLAARWWGPTVGGLLMGLPWFTGPVLFFLVQDKGLAYGVAACIGIELGVVCVAAFMLAYAAISTIARWPSSLAAAVIAFAAAAYAAGQLALSLWEAAAAAAATLAVTYLVLPRPRTPHTIATLPWWDIPMRMLATFTLVAAIMLGADALGPQLSGVVSTYPVILTVIGSFTHHQWGRDAVRRLLRGLTLSLFAFVVFFLVVGLTLPVTGLAFSYALAAAAAVGIGAALMRGSRRAAAR